MARDITRAYGLPDSILALGTDENVLIVEGDFNPTLGAGQPAPLGSLFLRTDTPGYYLKDSAPDTGWTLQGTGTASFVNRQQLVYVGKHGSASPTSNGRVPDDPFDTFSGAITYVNTQTPSSTNRFTILCQDSGTYAESFTIPSYVSVEARDTKVEGTITISDESELTIREVEASVNTSAVVKASGSASARVVAEILSTTGAGDTVTTSVGETSVLLLKCRQLFTENGSGVLDVSTSPSGHIHIDIEDIYVTGTGSGIDRASSDGFIVGRVAHILESGGGVGVGNAINVDSGRVELVIGFLGTTTSYQVAGAGTLKAVVSEIAGNTVQTSGAATVDVIEANILRWITVDDTDSPYTPRRIGYVAIDTTNGPVMMNLPTPPSDGDNVSFQDARDTFGTNNLTVDAGVGNLIDDGASGTQTVVFDINGTSGIFIYNGTLGRWIFSRIQEEVAFSPANLIYVTKNGDDTIGDGSFSNPFHTIKKGVTEALTRVVTTPITTTVKVLDGVYDEVNPINITGTNSELVQVQGESEFAIVVRPTVNNQPLFTMSSNVANNGPSVNRVTADASSLPAFKANNQAGIFITGQGRFVIDKTNIINCGIGVDSGNGTSTDQESVFDFAIISDCTTGIDAKGDGTQTCQVAFLRDNDVGIRASGNVRVEIGNYATQGANFDDPASGVGIELNDNAVVVATSGTISTHVTGIEANDNSNATLLTTSFANNTTDFNQVDGTARIAIQGALSKTNQLIADGANVTLNYIDTDTADFIVGNADSTGNPGKEFRIRDADGRVAIGDNAIDENIATGTVGASRSFNLIDENGNFRIWRFTSADGEDPAFEWIKGINPSLTDGTGDTPITSTTAATNTVVIDVSGTDYNGPFDTPYGINRETLAGRAFPAGRVIRINGTAASNGDYTVASATYVAGSPSTIEIILAGSPAGLVDGGAGGEVVWGGGAGRTDGVSTFVGNPGAAVAAGAGNVRWDMFIQEDDYFVIRRRTDGGGGAANEKARIYQDHIEWLGSTDYDDDDNATILYLQTIGSAVNYLQINNSITGNGPELVAVGTDTNIDIEMIPKGTGTVVVPAGYEANVIDDSLITKQYLDDNRKQYHHAHNGATTQTLTTAFVIILLNSVIRSDTIYSNTNGEVTINKTGWFKIAYEVSAQAEGGTLSGTESQLEVNTVFVPGSYSYGYHRTEIPGENTMSAEVLVNITSGDVVRVLTRETTGAVITMANACRLTISEIDSP